MTRTFNAAHALKKSLALVMILFLASAPDSWSAGQALQDPPGATLRATLNDKSIEARISVSDSGSVIASSTDPQTGASTTIIRLADGSTITAKTEVHVQPDGSKYVIAADDRGSRVEALVRNDGSVFVTRKNAAGDATHVERDPAGNVVSATVDENGNLSSAEARFPDASGIREDREGNVTAYAPQENGGLLQTMVFRNGNVGTVLTDASGEVVARGDALVAAKEPGQEYFEKVLGGADWSRLPNSSKVRYAASERDARYSAEAEARRKALAEADLKSKEQLQKAYAENKAKADAEIAAMNSEAASQDRERRTKQEIDRAIEKRKSDIAAAYEDAARLRKLHAAAVERGDMDAVRKIEREQDRASEASMQLLEFSAEEQVVMDRKQALRDQIMTEVIAAARQEATKKADGDVSQSVKEGITSVTKYASIGSAMQQETAKSTRLANFQVSFSEAKERRLRSRLENPQTLQEEREIIEDLLRLSEAQKEGAEEQLLSNAMLTAAGYTADVAMYAAGGGASKLLAYGAGKALAAKGGGTLAAAARTTSKAATKDLFAKVPIQSQVVKSMVANTVVGATVDAGVQVWRTGTVDPVEMARAAVIGTALSSVTSVVVPKVLPKTGARPEPSRPGAGAGAAEVPVTATSTTASLPAAPRQRANSATAGQNDGMTGGVFDRPGFKELPSKPPVEAPDLEIWMTPKEKAAAAAAAHNGNKAPQNSQPAPAPRRPIKTGSLWDRPEYKNLPSKTRSEAPDLEPWRTPAEKAAILESQPAQTPTAGATGRLNSIFEEPTTVITPDPPPTGRPTVYDQRTAKLTPEQSAMVGSKYDEHTVIITPDPPPATNAPAGAKIIYPVETSTRQPSPRPKPALSQPQPARPEINPAPPIPPTKAPSPASSRDQTTATNNVNQRPSLISPRDMKARYRATVPPKFQKDFDEAMDIVDGLIKADPRLKDVNYAAVAQNVKIQVESGVRPAELASTALNLQGHNGVRITPRALADATGLPPKNAEVAIQSGWKFLGHPDADIHYGGPGAPEPTSGGAEYDPIRDDIPSAPKPDYVSPKSPKLGGKYRGLELEMGESYKQRDLDYGVKIYNAYELEAFRVISDANGRMIFAKGGTPVNTTKGIYVMDVHGNVYVHEAPQFGAIHHSSLAGGRRPAAGGGIAVKDGKVLLLDEGTGHYSASQPAGRVRVVVKELGDQGVNTLKAIIEEYGK